VYRDGSAQVRSFFSVEGLGDFSSFLCLYYHPVRFLVSIATTSFMQTRNMYNILDLYDMSFSANALETLQRIQLQFKLDLGTRKDTVSGMVQHLHVIVHRTFIMNSGSASLQPQPTCRLLHPLHPGSSSMVDVTAWLPQNVYAAAVHLLPHAIHRIHCTPPCFLSRSDLHTTTQRT
jgi:hypothetical protein